MIEDVAGNEEELFLVIVTAGTRTFTLLQQEILLTA